MVYEYQHSSRSDGATTVAAALGQSYIMLVVAVVVGCVAE